MDYFEYLRAIRASDLSTKARIVALIIASYNPSFPTNKQIAEGTGLCERTVRSAKAELVAAGFMRQTRTFNAANHYTPAVPVANPAASHYQLNTNINTNINTKINTNNKSSNEDLYNSLNKIKPENITIKENSLWQ